MVNKDYYRTLSKSLGYLQSKLVKFGLSAESLTLYAKQPTYLPTDLVLDRGTCSSVRELHSLRKPGQALFPFNSFLRRTKDISSKSCRIAQKKSGG